MARRPHIKGVGSQRKLLTINWYGWVLYGSFGREGGKGEEATYERGWESEQITDLIGTGGYSMEVLVKSSVPRKPSNPDRFQNKRPYCISLAPVSRKSR